MTVALRLPTADQPAYTPMMGQYPGVTFQAKQALGSGKSASAANVCSLASSHLNPERPCGTRNQPTTTAHRPRTARFG